jgi:hypothetical protein
MFEWRRSRCNDLEDAPADTTPFDLAKVGRLSDAKLDRESHYL